MPRSPDHIVDGAPFLVHGLRWLTPGSTGANFELAVDHARSAEAPGVTCVVPRSLSEARHAARL